MDWRSKLYQCTICLKRFNTEIGRVDHQMEVHGDYSFYGVFTCSYESCTRTRTFRRQVDVGNHLKNPGKWHQRKGNIDQKYNYYIQCQYVRELIPEVFRVLYEEKMKAKPGSLRKGV